MIKLGFDFFIPLRSLKIWQRKKNCRKFQPCDTCLTSTHSSCNFGLRNVVNCINEWYLGFLKLSDFDRSKGRDVYLKLTKNLFDSR